MTTTTTTALVGFDTETTGTDPAHDRIVTAAFTGDAGAVNLLLNPGVPIPAAAVAVHGITDETARRDGMPAAEGVARIAAELAAAWAAGAAIVGHNVRYDLTIVHHEMVRHLGRPLTVAGPVLDTLVLDKQADRWRRGPRTLGALTAHYGVTLTDAHTADADAAAAVAVAVQLLDKLGTDPAELHTSQISWAARQAESLETYLRKKKDPNATVDRRWPVAA